MAILRIDRQVQTAQGQAVSGAKFYVLTQPANVENLTPLATVYSDINGTVGVNPLITDGLGQVGFYLDNSQLYTFVVVSPFIDQQVYPDQTSGASVTALSYNGVVPTGTIDGTNITFTIPSINAPVALFFFVNSAVLQPNVGYTMSFAAGVITIMLAQPPQPGDTLYAAIFS